MWVGGRNRTRKLYRSEPNTLCFRTYYALILKGFKSFDSRPVHCSSGVTSGKESGETISFRSWWFGSSFCSAASIFSNRLAPHVERFANHQISNIASALRLWKSTKTSQAPIFPPSKMSHDWERTDCHRQKPVDDDCFIKDENSTRPLKI